MTQPRPSNGGTGRPNFRPVAGNTLNIRAGNGATVNVGGGKPLSPTKVTLGSGQKAGGQPVGGQKPSPTTVSPKGPNVGKGQALLNALAKASKGGRPRPNGLDWKGRHCLDRLTGGPGCMPALCGGCPVLCCPVDDSDPDGPCMLMAVDPGSEEGGGQEPETSWQMTRRLRVANATNEKLTVYLQVKTQNDQDEWVWFPSQPGRDRVLAYELEPGQAADLMDGKWEVNGSRARLWAVGANQEYVAFRDKDLWLVPEMNDEGYHGYDAADIQTFEIAIR
jgi:hypothetical protein